MKFKFSIDFVVAFCLALPMLISCGHDNDEPNQGNPDATEDPVEESENKSFTVNDVAFEMIFVEGGTFQMGATPEQSNGFTPDSDEKPVHSVMLSDYYIGQTEVTQALWCAVMDENPLTSCRWSPTYGYGDNYPAYMVSFDECLEFVTRLNDLTGEHFRLPTEAEWEYAARGGVETKGYIFSGSDIADDVAWYAANSEQTNHEVAGKKANELGIFDMNGNVYEWCADWYGDYPAAETTNPTGSASGMFKVARGGSIVRDAANCRVAYRSYFAPDNFLFLLGLRLAM